MSQSVQYSHDTLMKIVYDLLNNLTTDPDLPNEDKKCFEPNNRHLLATLINILDKRIEQLQIVDDTDYFHEEWVVLVWSSMHILSRIHPEFDNESISTLNRLLISVVNYAKPVRIPCLYDEAKEFWDPFHTQFNNCLRYSHILYQQLENPNFDIDVKIRMYCERELQPCLDSFRQMCLHNAVPMHSRLRMTGIERLSEMQKLSDEDLSGVRRYYCDCLYVLGLLAARLQGFKFEINNLPHFQYPAEAFQRMMRMIDTAYEQLLCDALLSVEPSTSSILVTNNLFTFTCANFSRTMIFKNFDVQIVSEETAQAIQSEIKKVRNGERFASSPSVFPSAALLAMKPTSGVKRNNATANPIGTGGNTAHKKSDVNSKESVSLSPCFNEKMHGWHAQYPHLLCTTRQKDTVLLDMRSGQVGKRPLFYFYIRAKTFSPSGEFFYVRTLSLPFTIATRRNQDCQVQRMMSSYTATCFWLYGTCGVDGLMMEWNDTPLSWDRFVELCVQYFQRNADVHRPLLSQDFELFAEKMECDDCMEVDYIHHAIAGRKISFKNMLCPHLRFENETISMKFSFWRGFLEVLQLFQETKGHVKQLWDDGLIHGFLDTQAVVSLLHNHSNCMLLRLTFNSGGSLCLSYRTTPESELIHLDPIDLKRLQTRSVFDFLTDVAESSKMEYLLTADMGMLSVTDMISRYKNCDEVKGIGSVHSNVTDRGPVKKEITVRFTPLRVAVVPCHDLVSTTNETATTPTTSDTYSHHRNGVVMVPRAQVVVPPPLPISALVPAPQVSFEMQLESLMKMYGKSPNEVCDLFTFQPMDNNPIYHHPNGNPYLENPNNYEYC